MKIKWIGIGERIIQPYIWCKENGYIQDVPLEKAAELVTYPGNQFILVDPAEMPEVVSFVEGDPRPIEELKASDRRKSKQSAKSKPSARKNKE